MTYPISLCFKIPYILPEALCENGVLIKCSYFLLELYTAHTGSTILVFSVVCFSILSKIMGNGSNN